MVASPCINLCQMDPSNGLCRGCFRTLEEISRWSAADDAEKLLTLAAIAQRRQQTPQETPTVNS